jgi:hypothetical protein
VSALKGGGGGGGGGRRGGGGAAPPPPPPPAAEEAGVPSRGAPSVPRPVVGGEVHAVETEAEPVGEEKLEHVHEGPDEVAAQVGAVPDGSERRLDVDPQEMGPELVVVQEPAGRVGLVPSSWWWWWWWNHQLRG